MKLTQPDSEVLHFHAPVPRFYSNDKIRQAPAAFMALLSVKPWSGWLCGAPGVAVADEAPR